MVHNCTDWTATPPARKIPLLILTRGDDRVYTPVPKALKTLEEVARREFNLVDAEIHFSSSCLNLCNGLPARITESAWGYINPYIGCAIVEVSGPKAVPGQASENTHDKGDLSARQMLQPNADVGNENEPPDHTSEEVRDGQSGTSDHGDGHDGASVAEDQYEEACEEDVGTNSPRKPRNRYRLMSEDEDEDEEPEGERETPTKSQIPPVASPPKPTQPSKEVTKERDDSYLSHSKLRPLEPLRRPGKPIKQGKCENESDGGSQSYSNDGYLQPSHTETQYETETQAQVESSEGHKLMIRVAHRPSKQEAKFTTKGTTKVVKVLAAACKSFGLEAGRATLYLIVSTEDEDGELESLFPCDKRDTIAQAGAENNTESKFLLKITGEA